MEFYGLAAASLTFLAVFFSVFAFNLVLTDVFKKDQSEQLELDNEAFRDYERQRVRSTINKRRDVSLGELAAAAAADDAPRKNLWGRLAEICTQSGTTMTPMKVVVYGSVSGVLLGLLGGFLLHSIGLGVAFALLTACLPLAYVNSARKKRLELLRSQLPDAFELMSRILRSGQTITQGMNAVAEEFKPPVAAEFGYCYEQQNLGLDADIALKELAARTGLMELKIFVLSVLVHRQTGGNLTELLDKLATTVRQRIRIRGDISALTAEGRMQAVILLGLPIAVWIGMYFINRPYAIKLFDHPQLIIATLISMACGALWINKVVNFDF